MLNIVSIGEHVTRNVRKMKYYTVIMHDGTVRQVTKDVQGKLYLDGAEVVDQEDARDIQCAISTLSPIRHNKR